ncbi:uncharacterized protein LOC132182688 [Corylus avellana]|uniref:uncharacterized protein LOC132182688 n=1 Tax=Corylus avellana TaxID=13451 RepID=UPI00286B56A2|nr:uncharacterized protein LOC132182688 [Corylus avellana]
MTRINREMVQIFFSSAAIKDLILKICVSMASSSVFFLLLHFLSLSYVLGVAQTVKVLEIFGCAKRGYSSIHFLFNRQESGNKGNKGFTYAPRQKLFMCPPFGSSSSS